MSTSRYLCLERHPSRSRTAWWQTTSCWTTPAWCGARPWPTGPWWRPIRRRRWKLGWVQTWLRWLIDGWWVLYGLWVLEMGMVFGEEGESIILYESTTNNVRMVQCMFVCFISKLLFFKLVARFCSLILNVTQDEEKGRQQGRGEYVFHRNV